MNLPTLSGIPIANILRCSCVLNSIWLSSCVAPLGNERVSVPPRYQLEIVDRPLQRRFVVTLRSLDSRPLCLDIENWPNQFGQLHYASSWVKVGSPEGIYPARDKNLGYCLGECTIRIAPKSALTGFIRYAEFGDPSAIAALSQRYLQVVVALRVCRRQERGRPPP